MGSDTMRGPITKMREKFSAVRKLLDEPDQLSTEGEPYKTKYKAIEMLQDMESELSGILKDIPVYVLYDDRVFVMLAVIHLNLGILHSDTEELKAGEEQFMKCVELLKGRETDPEAIIPMLSALNQLGIIWSQWSQPQKAKTFLDRAEQLYNDFMSDTGSSKEPVHMSSVFGMEPTQEELNPRDVLEKVHTLTLYYLAQVYGSLKDHHKSAVYCHMTLCRQLVHGDTMQDLDHIDWALNAATLSQYFMENDGFPQARHHLAAASLILKRYEDILKKKYEGTEESEAAAADWEHFRHRSADVARCWAKYGIVLMSLSKQRLMQKAEKDGESVEVETTEKADPKRTIDLKFDVLEKDIEPIANQVTDRYLLDFNDARPVFLNAQKWLEEAKNYYTLENHASDYVLIAQDMSQAYKYLSFFEENEDRQAKMHKRRIDILEHVIEELNPQYYKAACRQIWIELGETYSDILDIKIDRLRETDGKPSAHMLAKINRLAKSAIQNFQAFLDSVETRKNADSIEQIPDDVVQPALFAYFHIGRLYNKIISPDKKVQLENIQNSMNAYRFVVDYCEKYPNVAEVMQVELNLCKELVDILLPLKINRLKREIED